MSPESIDNLAEKIIERMEEKGFTPCGLSKDEMVEVKGFVATKKKAVHYGVVFIGAVLLWTFKDIYQWVALHLHFLWR